jgi:hypothetical protein
LTSEPTVAGATAIAHTLGIGRAISRFAGHNRHSGKLSALVPPSGFWIALSDLPANPQEPKHDQDDDE